MQSTVRRKQNNMVVETIFSFHNFLEKVTMSLILDPSNNREWQHNSRLILKYFRHV
jgi:hypothetical protein